MMPISYNLAPPEVYNSPFIFYTFYLLYLLYTFYQCTLTNPSAVYVRRH